MKKEVYSFLRTYSSDPIKVNRLIVSSFLNSHNKANLKNKLICRLQIKYGDPDFFVLTKFCEIQEINSFEYLIELFEFVISPAEKIVNGAVYTPLEIRKYIIEESLKSFESLEDLAICDPSCGCAGFLYDVAKQLKRQTGRSYRSIFANNLFGLDIEAYSIVRSEILLALLAITEGEDEEVFQFNLHVGNALSFKWSKVIQQFKGFDIVLGNPPYVCSRNMDDRSLDLIYNWEVSKSGHPDLYIPFFQLGVENLRKGGILGFITVNTFLKSVNGRALREYFSRRGLDLRIINFGGEQVFRNRNTYTCLCFIKNQSGNIFYLKTKSSDLSELNEADYSHYDYIDLHDHDGWNLVNSIGDRQFIELIEATGKPLKDEYVTRNGIATLKNHVYKFTPSEIREDTYLFNSKSGGIYEVEKKICRDIVNANKINTSLDLQSKVEKIIFPYHQQENQTLIIEESEMISRFPLAYQYLEDHKNELSTRDKGNRDYETWYAYGRRQSLDIKSYKLFFPHISERPTFVISEDEDLLFYNGIAVISNDIVELRVLKIILESDIFFKYIKATTKDYASGYISMSKNYIKNFGICDLTKENKKQLLSSDDPEKILRKLYKIIEPEYAETDPEKELLSVAEPKQVYGK